MAELTNLLGGYGSGSDDEHDSPGGLLLSGKADGVVVRAGGGGAASTTMSPQAAAATTTSAGAAAAAGEGRGAAAASGPAESGDDEPAAEGGSQAHVIAGPSTNPEPPPEGQSPPVLPGRSMLSDSDGGAGDGGGGDGGGIGGPRARLPPELREPPRAPVDPAVLARVRHIDAVQRERGVTVMAQLSRDRRWNNPTFLEKMVAHFGLDPYGSCFRPEVWDPSALPEEDAWPRLEEERRAAAARRAEENARRDQVQFTAGPLQQPAAPLVSGLRPGPGAQAAAVPRAPTGGGAAGAGPAAAAARAPITSTDPRVLQAQALAQSLAAKAAAGLPPTGQPPAAKRSKWDA